MRILKLVIWDLDETLLTGILEEGDEEINPTAAKVTKQLEAQGILQALATQNPAAIMPAALQKFGWSDLFVQVEADLGSKARKVKLILDSLEVNPADVVFVDEDPFERASLAVQIPSLTTWSVVELATYLTTAEISATTVEARRRVQMYRDQQARRQGEATASDYTEFLRSCQIEITIRLYRSEDAQRVEELLTRTHRMNLGVLPVAEAVARLNRPAEHYVIIAEMKDIYGDMGRCGVLHLTPTPPGAAVVESLTISCRTRARGLSLAMLVGLLRHTPTNFQKYYCRYLANGSNRPLRMLLLAAGFKPEPDPAKLVLAAEQLAGLELPDWVQINYQAALKPV